MKYKLAKQLKDAGFLQEGGEGMYYEDTGERYYARPFSLIEHSVVIIPTLSELIEACGEQFGALILSKEGWTALSNEERYLIEYQNRVTKTPKIAVTKLWLKLNTK